MKNDMAYFDIDARRCAARDLILLLITNKHFGSIAMELLMKNMETLFAEYLENPHTNWRAKEKALFLAQCLSSCGCTQFATEDFFNEQIYTAFDHPDVAPALKISAIKLVVACGKILKQKPALLCIFSLRQNLNSTCMVVRNYSQRAIDLLVPLVSPRKKLLGIIKNFSKVANNMENTQASVNTTGRLIAVPNMDAVPSSSNADPCNHQSSSAASMVQPVQMSTIAPIRNLSELKEAILRKKDEYVYNASSTQPFENLQMLVF